MGKLDDDTQNLIEEIFNLYDKDKSGDLTIKETVRLLTDIIEMGGEANQEVIQNIVSDMDVNKDNKISKQEFSLLLKKHFI